MGGEVEMLRERISFLEEENDNLMIEKEIALTKMEQVILRVVPQRKLRNFLLLSPYESKIIPKNPARDYDNLSQAQVYKMTSTSLSNDLYILKVEGIVFVVP